MTSPAKMENFWGNNIHMAVETAELDFAKAKDMAKAKAMELSDDPMLLSWYNGQNGDYFPKVECGNRDKPVWLVFAESRGADMAININEGEFIFLYLSL